MGTWPARRFIAHVSAVFIVHLAFSILSAKTQRRENPLGTVQFYPSPRSYWSCY